LQLQKCDSCLFVAAIFVVLTVALVAIVPKVGEFPLDEIVAMVVIAAEFATDTIV